MRLRLICSILSCLLSTAAWCQSDSLDVSATQQSVSLRKADVPEPVAPFRDTLFYISAGFGSFTSHDRAVSITERIRNVSKDVDYFHTDSLSVVAEEGIFYIVYRDIIIMGVTETDAQMEGKTQLLLAHEYERLIKGAIVQHQKDTGWLTIMWRVCLELLIVVMLYLLIKIINRVFRKLSDKIEELKGTKIRTIMLKSYKLMDEEKATKFTLFLIKIVRYLIIILILYLSLPLIFSIFPATRNFAAVLFGYVLMPLSAISSGIIGFIPDLITIVVIILVFRYIIKGLHFLAEEIDKGRIVFKGFYSDWAYPTYHIVRTLLLVFMFIVIFPHLPGSDSRVFQGVSVFLGIVFSLGSSSVISNIVAGLVVTYMRPFKLGDRIKVGDVVGNVMEKTPLVTRVRTPLNEEITIPNSNIMSAQTFNYSYAARTYGLILHTKLTIGYDTPWRQVHELLLSAAGKTANVEENPKPFILQTALNDFYAEYQLNVYIVDADKTARVYSDLHQNIQDVFHEAGLELTSPHFQASRDGNHSTLPDSYLPDNYKAPAFNVKLHNDIKL